MIVWLVLITGMIHKLVLLSTELAKNCDADPLGSAVRTS